MSDSEKTPKQPKQSTDSQILIVATFFDTTWRMFIPILATTLIGYVIDKKLGSIPIGILSGLGLGLVIAILLVWQQYKSVKKVSK